MTLRLLLICGLAALLLAQPALAAPEPKLGKSAVMNTVSGTVKVKEKGKTKFGKLARCRRERWREQSVSRPAYHRFAWPPSWA